VHLLKALFVGRRRLLHVLETETWVRDVYLWPKGERTSGVCVVLLYIIGSQTQSAVYCSLPFRNLFSSMETLVKLCFGLWTFRHCH